MIPALQTPGISNPYLPSLKLFRGKGGGGSSIDLRVYPPPPETFLDNTAMTSDPITFTRDEAAQMLCPVRDKPCVADACAAFRWTHMRDGKSKAPVGHCGLSAPGAE